MNQERLISAEQEAELNRIYQLEYEPPVKQSMPCGGAVTPVITVCAWCKSYLGGSGDVISHGMCPACREKEFGRPRRLNIIQALALAAVVGAMIWAAILWEIVK